MVALPAAGSFLPRAGSNSSRAALIEQWLAAAANLPGASLQAQTLLIANGAIAPIAPMCFVDVQGGAADTDDLDTISVGTEWSDFNILLLRPISDNRTINVRNGVGNIVLKTSAFAMDSSWCMLVLQKQGGSWVELWRDYGQSYAQQRSHMGFGAPAVYGHATGDAAAAGTAQDLVMTPAAVSVALSTAALVVANRAAAAGLSPADFFLLERSGVLLKIGVFQLFASSFVNYVESGEISVAASNFVEFAHNMGSRPKLVIGVMRCLVADRGHAAGDELPLDAFVIPDGGRWVNYGANAANLWARLHQSATNMRLANKGTGVVADINPASWRFVLRAWA